MLAVLTLILIVPYAYAVQWPKGSYTLVKPKTGCPSRWREGWRKQDNEDERNSNVMPFGQLFMDEHAISGTQHWPRGNYCILRQGISCPPGFHMGSVLWDDENKRNSNALWGILPSGKFDKDTLINYCCRNDGLARTKINLPTNKPFYVLRFQSPCQEVQGMRVREENLKTDDEDDRNKSSVSGHHPLNDGGRDNRLYYCYYY